MRIVMNLSGLSITGSRSWNGEISSVEKEIYCDFFIVYSKTPDPTFTTTLSFRTQINGSPISQDSSLLSSHHLLFMNSFYPKAFCLLLSPPDMTLSTKKYIFFCSIVQVDDYRC
jgi:hypothetical protein